MKRKKTCKKIKINVNTDFIFNNIKVIVNLKKLKNKISKKKNKQTNKLTKQGDNIQP